MFWKNANRSRLFSAEENLLPAVKPTSQPADTFDNMVSLSKKKLLTQFLLLFLLAWPLKERASLAQSNSSFRITSSLQRSLLTLRTTRWITVTFSWRKTTSCLTPSTSGKVHRGSASYCLPFLFYFPLQALYLNMQDVVSCCGKESLFCFSPLLSIIKVMWALVGTCSPVHCTHLPGSTSCTWFFPARPPAHNVLHIPAFSTAPTSLSSN